MAKKKFKDEIRELRVIRGDLRSIKAAIADGLEVTEIPALMVAFTEAKNDIKHVIQDLRTQPGFTGNELKEEIRDLKNIKKDLIKLRNNIADGVDPSEIDALIADIKDTEREVTAEIRDLLDKGNEEPAGTTGGETGGGDDEEDPSTGGGDEDDPSTTGAGTEGDPITSLTDAVFSDGVTEGWSKPITAIVATTEYQDEGGKVINSDDFVVGSRVLVKETDGYRYRVYMIKNGDGTEPTGKFNLVLATDSTPWN